LGAKILGTKLEQGEQSFNLSLGLIPPMFQGLNRGGADEGGQVENAANGLVLIAQGC
jgi:hypothetical protein